MLTELEPQGVRLNCPSAVWIVTSDLKGEILFQAGQNKGVYALGRLCRLGSERGGFHPKIDLTST
jgi:hypothetical protein